MWIHIFVQLMVIGLFFLLGWVIRFKEQYMLLSGFNNRPEAEQKELIERGYPQKAGSLLIYTAVGMLLLFPLIFTSFPYVVEVQYGFMTLFLLGGFIYLSRFEIPAKRKKSLWYGSIFSTVVIGFIVILFYIGSQSNDLIVKRDTFEISGMYGNEWKLADIERIQVLTELPKVHYKENGFNAGNLLKGNFYLETFGSSLLFIRGGSPYLLIVTKDKTIFINGEDSKETQQWYKKLNDTIQ
ncbi:DUF3784 domain-containing protein [Niallia sp. XMNu-256]|uniref:DUF3784 domain-containing protein n=1 Tax=Niallia sp. XMNu-256 TaxID=3082444 RepID=UPI0030D353E8